MRAVDEYHFHQRHGILIRVDARAVAGIRRLGARDQAQRDLLFRAKEVVDGLAGQSGAGGDFLDRGAVKPRQLEGRVGGVEDLGA